MRTCIQDDSLSQSWNRNYQRLIEFGQQFGHCNVASNYRVPRVEESGLGMWLSSQRRRWKKGLLLPERQTKLQELVNAGLMKWEIHDVSCT
jgi:hypothetical protein